MKKQLIFVTLFVVFAIVAHADYLIGPNNIFNMHAVAGFNFKGLWVEGTMSDAPDEPAGINYSKRVYARSGAAGTYSAWKTPTTIPITVTHRDYGSFTDDYAEVRGEWKQLQ